MAGLEEKLKEIEDRINRLENKLKVSLFEVEKLASQPKQEPVEERFLEMEDLILLLQLENTKIKEKLSQDIDVELTPKISQNSEERISRLEEEIGNLRSSRMEIETEEAKPVPRALVRHEGARKAREEEEHPLRQKEELSRKAERKKEEEEETIRVRGSVLEDLQKILSK